MCELKKRCNKCNVEKFISEFHKARREKDGLCSTCKTCKKEILLLNIEVFTEPKKCIACFIEKPVDEYTKDKYVVGGYKKKCKLCVVNKIKAYLADKGFKVCTICLETKSQDCFMKMTKSRDGFSSQCKDCAHTEELKLYRVNYYEENKQKIKQQQKDNYLLNKDDYLKRAEKYYENNKETIKEYRKTWNKNNRDKINYNKKEKMSTDVVFKLRLSVYANISPYLKRHLEGRKQRKTLDVLGCTIEEFKKHIESQFLNWMNWDNYGNACETLDYNCSWDLDHIIPISYAKTEEEIYLLNHWSNFQPLCSKVNRNHKKGKVPLVTNLELNINTI